MVYRGKPSAGCESCRKAKKRCTLEQPACARCIKLKKPCVGYRDTTELQIQDESEAVKLKAARKAQQVVATAVSDALTPPSRIHAAPYGASSRAASSWTDFSSASSSSASDDADHDVPPFGHGDGSAATSSTALSVSPQLPAVSLQPTVDEVAFTHFFKQFISEVRWRFLADYAKKPRRDPCLELAIRACGMAALNNVEYVVKGREYARAMYIEALGLLNGALRDPKRCKTDESLIAVAMLGYYENLTCDSKNSIDSWKAHIAGATQLLKIRGKAQFKTQVGRILFREIRSQILIHCIWDDFEPPAFLWDWETELEQHSEEHRGYILGPTDSLIKICWDLASVRAKVVHHTIADADAADICLRIDQRLTQWEVAATTATDGAWHFDEMEVPDSPDVWNGIVHVYSSVTAPQVLNTYRLIRILCTRTQELLYNRFPFSDEQRNEHRTYFRRVRRQMTDEICAGVPSCLGYGPRTPGSSAVLLPAYASVWPLYFAAMCVLERMLEQGQNSLDAFDTARMGPSSSAAAAQAAWILGRMHYITNQIGIRWASGMAASVLDDFRSGAATGWGGLFTRDFNPMINDTPLEEPVVPVHIPTTEDLIPV